MLSEDPYELLGLGHLRWRANEDQIKKACTCSRLRRSLCYGPLSVGVRRN
jgi:hypothetical protein